MKVNEKGLTVGQLTVTVGALILATIIWGAINKTEVSDTVGNHWGAIEKEKVCDIV